MKFLSSERLSQHKYKTPEGYLICVDAILARTGKQTYRKNEVFADAEDDSEIEVDRKPEEVFSPTTLASFENKPITVEHPDEDVNAGNYNELSVGFVRDVHKGVAEGQDVMLGTLVITDAQTIEEIENGEHTDLSCGYDCDIVDETNPQQRNIRGNHVALCQCGRAGIARIVDSTKIKDGKYIVHFKNKNGGEDKDIVVEAKGMSEAVEIAKTYVSDYYYKYKSVKPYYGDSVKDSFAILHPKNYEFLSVGGRSWVKEDSTNIQRFATENEALEFGKKYVNGSFRLMKLVDSVKDTNIELLKRKLKATFDKYNMNRDEAIAEVNNQNHLTDDEIATLTDWVYEIYKTVKDAQSVMFRGENTFIFANKDMIPERTHYKEDVEYNGKEYYYHEGFDTKRKYLVPIVDSVKDDLVFGYTEQDLRIAKNMLSKAVTEQEKKLIESLIAKIEYELTNKEMRDAGLYVIYADGTWNNYRALFFKKSGPAKYSSERDADKFSEDEANRIIQSKGKYKWIKRKVGNDAKDELIQSSSEEAFKENIATEIESGKSPEQATAIAYSIKRKNDSKKFEVSYMEDSIEHIHIVRAKDLKDAIQKLKRK